jgi:hypothetical protein
MIIRFFLKIVSANKQRIRIGVPLIDSLIGSAKPSVIVHKVLNVDISKPPTLRVSAAGEGDCVGRIVSFSGRPSKYEYCKQYCHVDEKAHYPLTIQILHPSIPEKDIDMGRKCGSTHDYGSPPSLVREDAYSAYDERHCSQD